MNTTAKHTPAPWRIERRHKYVDVVIPTGKIGLPNETGECVFTPTPYYDLKQQEANARLISAAPELLEAMLAVEDDLWRYASKSGPGPDKRLERFRAAIAKATS